jgi:hypothetical protein
MSLRKVKVEVEVETDTLAFLISGHNGCRLKYSD